MVMVSVDLLIGAVHTSNGLSQSGRTYVVFGDAPPVLVNNRLSLSVGAAIQLNSTYLSAYDRNHNNNTLVFVPTNISHGHFELVNQPGVALINFTQPQLINGSVRFVHDGSSLAPSYNISVYSAGIAWTGPSAANITFIPTMSTPVILQSPTATPTVTPTPTLVPTPMLLNNQLTLSDGETVVLSST